MKLKSDQAKLQSQTKFDPNLIDERVRDFFFDPESRTIYVTLLCGQLFIFESSAGETRDYKISRKVTLKQKILKMKKIAGFRKELVDCGSQSEHFEDQLEAMTTTTTQSRTISLVSSRRSSSLFRGSGSQLGGNSIPSRSRSLRKYASPEPKVRHSLLPGAEHPTKQSLVSLNPSSLTGDSTRMSVPLFSNQVSSDPVSQFEGMMSFKKHTKKPDLLGPDSPRKLGSPDGSLDFEDTILQEAVDPEAHARDFSADDPSQLKDYLILLVDTSKHSTRNAHKNIKLLLFDLEQNKIAMLYELKLGADEYSLNRPDRLPQIRLMQDKIHFCVWTPANLWVFDLFSPTPIVNLLPDPGVCLHKVSFSLDFSKLLLGFSNGDLVFYKMLRQYHPLYQRDCLSHFEKLVQCNVHSLGDEHFQPPHNEKEDRLLDFQFLGHQSSKLMLSVLTSESLMMLSLTLETLNFRIEDIRRHNLEANGQQVDSFVLENPLTSKIDLIFFLGSLIHHQKVSFYKKDNSLGFLESESGQWSKPNLKFDRLCDVSGPGLIGHDMDSQGNFKLLRFYEFSKQSSTE